MLKMTILFNSLFQSVNCNMTQLKYYVSLVRLPWPMRRANIGCRNRIEWID
jgi:hypothetical protein